MRYELGGEAGCIQQVIQEDVENPSYLIPHTSYLIKSVNYLTFYITFVN